MGIKLKNNARSTLLASITAADTIIVLESGGGSAFPSLSLGEHFYATIVATSGSYEIVDVTARSGDVLTVTRGAESTTATAFPAGSLIELRVTAAAIVEATTAVTSINVSGGTTGLTFSGGPITTSGTITAAGTLVVGNGGTGRTSYTANGVIYASSTSALASGSALTFDGTNLVTTGTATATKFVPTGGSATGNGMYLPAANTVAFSTNDTERMRISSAGDVGINTTPASKLHVVGTGSEKIIFAFGAGTLPTSNAALNVWTNAAGTSTIAKFVTSDGTGSEIGGFSFSDIGAPGDWTVPRLDMTQSYGGAAELRALIQVEDSTWAGMKFTAQTKADAALTTSPAFIWNNYTTELGRFTSGGTLAIGTNSPSAVALLEVSSTTKGFLPPRMTTAQRDAISAPPDGLMLYNTSTNKLQVRAAGSWVDLH